MTIAVIHLDAPGYCECGCGSKTTIAKQTHSALGYTKGKPVRFLVGHHWRGCPVDFVEDVTTHCWLWCLNKDHRGYGTRNGGRGRPELAHRLLYEELVGEIPPDLELDHLCRVPVCVNPGHLEPVTHAENMRRGSNAKLSHANVREIRGRWSHSTKSARAFARDIGPEFGVGHELIRGIVSGQKWKGV